MQAATGRAIIAIATMLTLAACGNGGAPELMNLRSGQGPDEFAIVPPNPLEMPENLADLPEPTPNGSNRTDVNPLDDAVVALGAVPGQAFGSGRDSGGRFCALRPCGAVRGRSRDSHDPCRRRS